MPLGAMYSAVFATPTASLLSLVRVISMLMIMIITKISICGEGDTVAVGFVELVVEGTELAPEVLGGARLVDVLDAE